jgi:glycosyltransferase involved in cell wall biosynthesis
MNVWIVNHHAVLPSQGGGTRHYHLGKELVRNGHKVTVICTKTPHQKSTNALVPNKIEVWQEEALRFLFLPTPIYLSSLKRLWSYYIFARSVLKLPKILPNEKPDIVIGSSVHPFAAWAAERIATHFRVPFCFEVRDLWPQTLIDMGKLTKYHPLSLLLRRLEGNLYRKARRIITLLPFADEYISQFSVDKKKIIYIPNGVDLDFFVSRPLQEQDSLFTIMYVGSFGEVNHLETLIEAACDLERHPGLKQVLFRLIGDGNQRKLLQSKIDAYGLKNVQLEVAIPKDQVPSRMSEANVLLLHGLTLDVHKYGVSPNKLSEYLSAERPIILASQFRNDAVQDSCSGVSIPSKDPIAMAEAIRLMMKTPYEEQLAMGKRARSYAKRHHCFKILGLRLQTLLDESVNEAKS